MIDERYILLLPGCNSTETDRLIDRLKLNEHMVTGIDLDFYRLNMMVTTIPQKYLGQD